MFNQKGSLALKAGVGLVVVIAIVAGWALMTNISYDNKHQGLVADIEKIERNREANYDKMSKTILQQAGVLEKYSSDFKEVYKNMMTGRYGENGSQAMWQWLKEHNPQLDASLYKTLMVTIEAQRAGFNREQEKLSQLAAEDKKLFTLWPGTWFTSGEPREVMIVSSTKAKQVMETGIDDDVDLFKKE